MNSTRESKQIICYLASILDGKNQFCAVLAGDHKFISMVTNAMKSEMQEMLSNLEEMRMAAVWPPQDKTHV